MSTTSPQTFIVQTRAALFDLAEAAAHADAAVPLDAESPSPTPGEVRLRAKREAAHLDLVSVHGQAAMDARVELAARTTAVRTERAIDPVEGPLPSLRAFPALVAILVVLGLIDAVALRPAVQALFSADSIWESVAVCALFVGLLEVVCARASRSFAIRNHSFGRRRDMAAISGVLLGGLACGASVAVVGARVFAARLAASATSGVLTLDAVAFLAAFQLVVVIGMLLAGRALEEARFQAATIAAHDRLRTAETDATQIAELVADHGVSLPHLQAQLDAACTEALIHYRTELRDLITEVFAQVAWGDRLAAELEGGTLLSTVFPGLPGDPRPSPAAAGGSPAGPAGGDDAHREPPSEPHRAAETAFRPRAPGEGAPETETDDAPVGDGADGAGPAADDLISAVLGGL